MTQLFEAAARGDAAAQGRAWPAVYDELRHLGRAQWKSERAGEPLQATVLVNEAYLRLVGPRAVKWLNRRHFFGAAAEAMRRIRIDQARRRRRVKRGGGRLAAHNDVDVVDSTATENAEELLAISDAIDRLKKADPRKGDRDAAVLCRPDD